MQHKSMNHNFYWTCLKKVVAAVGKDVRDDLKKSSIGVLLRLMDVDYIWSAKLVHYFLANQLSVKNSHEVWSLIVGQPIRFSLYEFADITRMNCNPFQSAGEVNVDHKEFWAMLGVGWRHGPTFLKLEQLFTDCRKWPFEKRRMLGYLCILSIGILGVSPGSRIPLESAKLVVDPEAFDRYPWGRVAFKSLVDSIKLLEYEKKKKYTVHGCVHVLMVWAFESVIGLGATYGNRLEGSDIPLLSWRGTRRRIVFDDFCLQERELYDKVPVRHLIRMEEIFPKWEEENADKELENMITDILNDQLDVHAWDSVPLEGSETDTCKRKSAATNDVDAESNKRIRTTVKPPLVSRKENTKFDGEMGLVGIVDMLKKLTEKVDGMDKSVAEKVLCGLDERIDRRVEAKVTPTELELRNKISDMEREIKLLKEKLLNTTTKVEATHTVNNEDEVQSNSDPVNSLCHHINGNHWVALRVDFRKSIIHVYDSIIKEVMPSDKDIIHECLPFAKMIPLLLNEMVPTTVRKRSEKKFLVRRLKSIPQNLNPGDCGVYTLKYIECLALGDESFDGLSDKNIHTLRVRLAAEIYDEVANE